MNNFNKIKPLLNFESEDDFYFLQLLRRKKDNPEMNSNSKVVKNYYITSIEYLESKMPEIIELCDKFNARASLRLNKRSFESVAFKTMVNVVNVISNRDFKFVRNCYDRACGQSSNQKTDKRWIIDLDGEEAMWIEHPDHYEEFCNFVNSLQPEGEKVKKVISSKTGYHVITNPFNKMHFKERFPQIGIHTDNPVNLYVPNTMNLYTPDGRN